MLKYSSQLMNEALKTYTTVILSEGSTEFSGTLKTSNKFIIIFLGTDHPVQPM